MTAKHTPGEWRAVGRGIFAGDQFVGEAEFGADCNAGTYDEALANARLFAAAPGLLAALKAAEGHLEEMRCDPRWHPIGDCPVLNQVRAAIAKAEGR